MPKVLTPKEALAALIAGKKIAGENWVNGRFICINDKGDVVNEKGNIVKTTNYFYNFVEYTHNVDWYQVTYHLKGHSNPEVCPKLYRDEKDFLDGKFSHDFYFYKLNKVDNFPDHNPPKC